MNWTHIGGEVYVNHRMSSCVLKYALYKTVIVPFTCSPPIGRKWPGDIGNKLHVQLTDAIKFKSLDDFDNFNPFNPRHTLLSRQLAYRLETAAGMAFLNQTYAHTFTGKINKFLDHGEMDRISHCKPYDGISYVGLASTGQMELLMQHRAWEFWHQYLKTPGSFVYKHELGKIYNIRWVETSLSWWPYPVIFGAKAVARLEIETPHLRANLKDKTVAVYGGVHFAKGWDPDESPRIVHLKPISRRFAMRIGTVEKYRQVVKNGIASLGEM